MSDAARLVGWARKRQGITVQQLAVRSGLSPTLIAEVESSQRDLNTHELSALLFVCGLHLRQSPTGELSGEPLPLDVDEQELAHARSLTMSERLESALGWNSFADRVFQAGQRVRS